ncbi:2-hydroxychromene-2-carboxylate isomerase [Alphaproteobacteria bacterium]|nr:2-hydroxychromene-2-carboxylate isomerase [Alphaproteobacteria bacterium]
MKSIDFYYDYGSPTAYLAWTQLSKQDNNKYQINYNPVLLGGIFAATSNRSPIHVDAKAKWMWRDLQKYAGTYNVVLNHNDAFPVNTLYLMRGAIYAKKNNVIEKYNEIMFKAMWMSNINLSEPDNIINTLKEGGFDSEKFLSAAENQEIKDELKSVTSVAIEKGLFGVPTFIIDGELIFGQDRMHWFLN